MIRLIFLAIFLSFIVAIYNERKYFVEQVKKFLVRILSDGKGIVEQKEKEKIPRLVVKDFNNKILVTYTLSKKDEDYKENAEYKKFVKWFEDDNDKSEYSFKGLNSFTNCESIVKIRKKDVASFLVTYEDLF